MTTKNNNSTIKLDNIHDAIDDIRQGKVIIVVDDEDVGVYVAVGGVAVRQPVMN